MTNNRTLKPIHRIRSGVLMLVGAALFGLSSSMVYGESLFLGGEFTNGGYGGPVIRLGQFDGDVGLMVGARGGWVINHQIVVGAGGYYQVSKHAGFDKFGYGGLLLEWIIIGDALVHGSISTLIGLGTMGSTRPFYVFEPVGHLMLNLTEAVRLGFGLGYRRAFATSQNSRLSGVFGEILVKFGRF